MPLGIRIRMAREQAHISQTELARRIGMSKTAMNALEGEAIDPRRTYWPHRRERATRRHRHAWPLYRWPLLHSALAVLWEILRKIRLRTCKMPTECRFLSQVGQTLFGSTAALRRAVTPCL